MTETVSRIATERGLVGAVYRVREPVGVSWGCTTRDPSGAGHVLMQPGEYVMLMGIAPDGTSHFLYRGARCSHDGNGWCPGLQQSLEYVDFPRPDGVGLAWYSMPLDTQMEIANIKAYNMKHYIKPEE